MADLVMLEMILGFDRLIFKLIRIKPIVNKNIIDSRIRSHMQRGGHFLVGGAWETGDRGTASPPRRRRGFVV
jgi:hypothetical protein